MSRGRKATGRAQAPWHTSHSACANFPNSSLWPSTPHSCSSHLTEQPEFPPLSHYAAGSWVSQQSHQWPSLTLSFRHIPSAKVCPQPHLREGPIFCWTLTERSSPQPISDHNISSLLRVSQESPLTSQTGFCSCQPCLQYPSNISIHSFKTQCVIQRPHKVFSIYYTTYCHALI